MRLVFSKEDQIDFFRLVKERSRLNRDGLGLLVAISGRSFSDWASGNVLPREDGVRCLSARFGVSIPKILNIREEWWSGRVNGRRAGLIGLAKHGVPGSLESRIKGGIASQLKRRENPDYYRKLGCNVPNAFRKPGRSQDLAEFVGLVLGDGGLTRDQCQIYLSYRDDVEYAVGVALLVERLFGYKPSIFEYPSDGCRRVIITGVDFVKMMREFGLLIGNKVRNQVGIPEWIKQSRKLYTSCVRGLFDTDGGTFSHTHWIGRYKYRHFGLTFTSASRLLLNDFHCYLDLVGIKHRVSNINLFVYDLEHVKKFFDLVKPDNAKHFRRLHEHLNRPTRLN